jgi:Plasmid pRiA4b ORF-3-like protein
MAGTAARASSYQLKVELKDVAPTVWRRIVLPGHWHLGFVHTALQRAMGWQDSHLHEFEVDGVPYGEPEPDSDSETRAETTARLLEVLPTAEAQMFCSYDFGDGWRHQILVETIGEPVSTAPCLARGAGLPTGGLGWPWGYDDMLAAVRDPQHPDRGTFLEWLGDDFDPEAFDVTAVYESLALIR